jgi:tetratricopeptide (TPR) repeat protein
MKGRLFIVIKIIVLSSLLSSATTEAQILKDSATLILIRKDIDHIYNFEFDKARDQFEEIANLYPDHPIVFLLRGIAIYWENYPLLPTEPSHELFEEAMYQCIELSEKNKHAAYESEYLLANLCARGMLLMFYSDNDQISDVIPLTISSYKYLRKSFFFTSTCTDLYYFTGLYNYYREAYPKEYPVYKSLAMLFPPGSMEAGLKELQTCAMRAVVLGPESYYLLTWIYMNFENNCPSSLVYSKKLIELYPANALYKATFIKNLFLLKKYDEAERFLPVPDEEGVNRYLRSQILIFNGLLQEKKYRNYDLALEYYNKGIHEISFSGEYGNEYAAYAYFGLARISESNGDNHAARIYRNQASRLAEFKKINFNK